MPALEPRSALPPGWPQVLRTIVEGPAWWQTPDDLARRLKLDDKRGHPLPVLAARLQAMEQACWLYRWVDKATDHVTLSGEAAERLGCELRETEGETRWHCAGGTISGPWPKSVRREFTEGELSVLAIVPDPGPGPEAIAEAHEVAERLLGAALAEYERTGKWTLDIDDPRLRPLLVLTGSQTLWWEYEPRPGKPWNPPGWCSACLSKKLVKHGLAGSFCARCARWAWDHYFGIKPARERQRA